MPSVINYFNDLSNNVEVNDDIKNQASITSNNISTNSLHTRSSMKNNINQISDLPSDDIVDLSYNLYQTLIQNNYSDQFAWLISNVYLFNRFELNLLGLNDSIDYNRTVDRIINSPIKYMIVECLGTTLHLAIMKGILSNVNLYASITYVFLYVICIMINLIKLTLKINSSERIDTNVG